MRFESRQGEPGGDMTAEIKVTPIEEFSDLSNAFELPTSSASRIFAFIFVS
jgi:hypothetical protein